MPSNHYNPPILEPWNQTTIHEETISVRERGTKREKRTRKIAQRGDDDTKTIFFNIYDVSLILYNIYFNMHINFSNFLII